ncbi:MAG TPA: NarK family nitrate/nitrite MFS transporter [Polyangiaceae bacterium]
MSRWIANWNPENETFWETEGRFVARRNLFWSILAEHIGFSVWLMWSIVAPRLPKMGFAYTTDQLFTLVAVPGLIGALMRFPYTFAVPKFGGRNWTIVSALLLLIPSSLLVAFVRNPATPFSVMLLAAATAGLGGGNFASSMANISFFYPDRKKGLALGLNAAGGNIGVSSVQLIAPMVIGIGVLGGSQGMHLENVGLMWIIPIAIATFGAFAFMDNLASAKSNFADQVAVAKHKQTWIMSILYVATFGSFVGYSAAFPLLLKTQFPQVTANLAFLGALIGSIARPIGGQLSDKLGGARVTFWNFVVMAAATFGALHFIQEKDFAGFLTSFLLLFVTTGIGNGSTFRMIPVIFRTERMREVEGGGPEARERAMTAARRDSAAVLGLSSAIGALGGYFIPKSFGASIKATGGPETALGWFIAYYCLCIVMTWWYYRRTSFMVQRLPSLAGANA